MLSLAPTLTSNHTECSESPIPWCEFSWAFPYKRLLRHPSEKERWWLVWFISIKSQVVEGFLLHEMSWQTRASGIYPLWWERENHCTGVVRHDFFRFPLRTHTISRTHRSSGCRTSSHSSRNNVWGPFRVTPLCNGKFVLDSDLLLLSELRTTSILKAMNSHRISTPLKCLSS